MTYSFSRRRARPPLAAAFLACCIVCSGLAFAQSTGTPPPPTDGAQQGASVASKDEDDDAVLRPLEPDYTLIDLPTTLPLPAHKSDFHLLHRFNGNLRDGTFSNTVSSAFGIDEGAVISLEYRYGLVKHVQVAVSRTNFNRTIQFSGKYDAFHQSASHPVGFSAIVSVEGVNNFHKDHAPALGASISRGFFNAVELFVDPIWVHNSAAATGVTRNTAFVGVGGHVRVLPALYLAGEVSPRVGGYVIGDAEYGFGVEGRVGGHTFALTFTNSQATTFGQLSRGGFPNSLYLGFNLSRKFF
jgi:hypothetical protein